MIHDVALARGLVDTTGARHRRARLRPPTGLVELDLAEHAADGTGLPPEEADRLLAGCVARIGGFDSASGQVTAALVAGLSRGDRARLALAIRATLQGDPLLLTVRCPAAGCGALADLTLSTADLVSTGPAQPPTIEIHTPDGDLAIRPPTGQDVGADDDALWGALVSRSGRPLGAAGWRELDPVSVQLVAAALAGLDPCADLAVVTACPRCGCWIEVEVDPVELLARSLATGEQRLLAEVHTLALHYGWSEDQILGLPRPRRHAYLELLRDHLDGRPLTGAGA